MTTEQVQGPYFDELRIGLTFPSSPACTLTDGRAAAHQSIVGDRLRLPLDDTLAGEVTGRAPLVHPAFLWDVAIGQSTVATHHVKANLFYRRFVLRRLPAVGDTIRTATTVVGLRQNRRKPGRAPTGMAVLRMVTVDQEERPVLDFYRCAMLPLRRDVETGHDYDLDTVGAGTGAPSDVPGSVEGWDLDAWRARVPTTSTVAKGRKVEVVGGDVVSGAPELARLTLNVAMVHHDARASGGRRLVYGGHTIGVALSQATRAFPDMVTVLAWHGCDHLGPVYEGDTLRSEIEVEGTEPGPSGGVVAHLRSTVSADDDRPVLDWRYAALFA